MKQSNKIFSLIIIVISILMFSCDSNKNPTSNTTKEVEIVKVSDNKNKTISDLLQLFEQKGIKGVKEEKAFVMIGAEDGCSYSGEGFSLEVYKFADKSKIPEFLTNKNEYFAMLIHKGNKEKIVQVFNSFK